MHIRGVGEGEGGSLKPSLQFEMESSIHRVYPFLTLLKGLNNVSYEAIIS